MPSPVSFAALEKNDSDYAIALELLTEFKLIVDSMEQARERPCDQAPLGQ